MLTSLQSYDVFIFHILEIIIASSIINTVPTK